MALTDLPRQPMPSIRSILLGGALALLGAAERQINRGAARLAVVGPTDPFSSHPERSARDVAHIELCRWRTSSRNLEHRNLPGAVAREPCRHPVRIHAQLP